MCVYYRILLERPSLREFLLRNGGEFPAISGFAEHDLSLGSQVGLSRIVRGIRIRVFVTCHTERGGRSRYNTSS